MQLRRHNPASRFACVATLCLALLTGQAAAAPVDGQPSATDAQTVTVDIRQPTPSITTQGRMRATVDVTLSTPAEYVEVRFRLRQPGGRLVYQKTEVRTNSGPGTYAIEFEHDLRSLDLEQGRYPIEVRVLATGTTATTVSSRLLLIEPGETDLSVALVVGASAIPAVTADGRFAIDPMDNTHLRDDLAFITQLASDRRAPLALAIPPVLTEQLGRAEAGYETTAGVRVAADADVALRTARVLDSLRSAVATGTIDLIDVPYALPDLGRLARFAAGDDLALHWSRADAVNAAVLHSGTDPGVAYVGPLLTSDAIASLGERGVGCVLAPAAAVRSGEATATPGCYEIEDQDVRVLVLDEEAAAGARTGAEEFYDALFSRLDDGAPVVVMLDIGTGDPSATAAVQHALDWIEDASWLRLTDLGTLADRTSDKRVRLARSSGSLADSAYWTEIEQGRAAGLAYVNAVGIEDSDALAVLRGLLISESSLFPAAYGEDAGAYDGSVFAQGVSDFVAAQFALIRLDSKDVTLSGTRGEVPLTLINDTGKHLRLTLHTEPAAVVGSPVQDVDIQPTQNFLTVPIDLGNTLSDTLKVEVMAGGIKVTETTVEVRASYIDRLAIILMVILVLGGLLVLIRRRVLSADAVTIVADAQRRDSRL